MKFVFTDKKITKKGMTFFDVQRPASGIEDKNLTEEVQPQRNKNKERYFEKRKI